jgi:ABC-type branched-subunit amino acid transport system ATPase component
MEATMNSTNKPPLNQRPLLEVQDIYSGYQPDFDILNGVSLHVKPTEIVCVIGPNGAGKSTIFKALFGFLKVSRGRVLFDDRDITNIRPQDALLAGITIVPQLRSVFPQMTVFENLEMGMYLEKDKERIKRRINFMWEPKLMLMDEPSAGLAPLITRTIFNDVHRLNREIGLTVLMIEQNAQQGLKISDRGYVLELGRNSYEGTGQELLENEEVRRAFLGGR